MKIFQENLERKVDKRAFDGYLEPVFYEGEVCGHKRKYSDTMALARLKRIDPAYRDSNQTALIGDGATVNIYVPENERPVNAIDADFEEVESTEGALIPTKR